LPPNHIMQKISKVTISENSIKEQEKKSLF
jgi:hypothetical protein